MRAYRDAQMHGLLGLRLNPWRSGTKAASRGIPLAAALQTLPPGRRQFGVRWQAKRDTAFLAQDSHPIIRRSAFQVRLPRKKPRCVRRAAGLPPAPLHTLERLFDRPGRHVTCTIHACALCRRSGGCLGWRPGRSLERRIGKRLHGGLDRNRGSARPSVRRAGWRRGRIARRLGRRRGLPTQRVDLPFQIPDPQREDSGNTQAQYRGHDEAPFEVPYATANCSANFAPALAGGTFRAAAAHRAGSRRCAFSETRTPADGAIGLGSHY